MDATTQQLAHRVGIFLAAGMIAAAFLYLMIVGIMQGDGEATRLASQLQPYVMAAFWGLMGLLGINSLANAAVQIYAPPQPPAPPAPPQGVTVTAEPAAPAGGGSSDAGAI